VSSGGAFRRTEGADSADKPFLRPSGRASYPRRVTLDLDDGRYEWIKQAAWESRVSMTELLRGVIDLLASDPAVLERAAQAAAGESEAPAPAAEPEGRADRTGKR